MTNQSVMIFESDKFGQIRTAGTSENPLFCLSDVCKALGLSSKGVNQRLSDEVISNYPIIDSLGREQRALFVNEDGLYDVILDSRKPEAKSFRKWITSEVLPSIRKNGGYIATNEDDDAEMILAKALKVADATIKRKEQQLLEQKEQIDKQIKTINKMKPLADYCNDVLQSDSTYTLTQVSKDLGFKSVYKFLDWANKNILYKQSNQWMPTARYSDKGLFRTRTTKYFKSDGTIGTKMSTVVTEKGREFLHNIISNNK